MKLNAYGYTDIHKLEREQSRPAKAVKTGREVHVSIDGKDQIATYRGR